MKAVNLSLILVGISLFIFLFSVAQVDPDLWGHLKFGEDMFTQQALPRYDAYSYSSYGAPWINHEWLSELIFYLIFNSAKSAALIAFKLLAGLFITFLLYISIIKNTKSIYLRLLFMAFSLSLICQGFSLRPQIFTYVFFTGLVFLIDNFENTKDARWLSPLPVIFLLWTNLHAGFLSGIGMLLIYAFYKLFKKEITKNLIFITIISLLATLINPYGAKIWLFTLGAVTKYRFYITEWRRVDLSLGYFDYFALGLASAVGFLFSRRKRLGYEIASILIAFYFSFQHNRHVVLFAILASLYLPKYISSFAGDWFRRYEKRFSQNIFIPIFVCLSLVFISATFYRGKNLLAIEIPQEKFPVNAVWFMKRNHITGNIFCSFDWAQMCIRELPATSKVFFDGRYETVYKDGLIRGFFEVISGKRNYKEFLKNYPPTDIMFLKKSEPLAQALSKDEGWVRIYSSSVAQIYLNDNKHNKNVIDNFKDGRMTYLEEKPRPYYLDHL